MQAFEEIEKSYNTPDPWGYKTNPLDARRKAILTGIAGFHGPYEKCLDIGAGEGWITEAYPAKILHGLEVSNQAAARFPENVKRVVVPEGKYDLICATGIFYGHYNWPFFLQLIKEHASKHVLVSSIASWELKQVDGIGKEIFRAEYVYNVDKQRTRIFEVKS